jgi:uncharacterized ion transporter superfamily protein YfcC
MELNKSAMQISLKSFAQAAIIILVLMIGAGILTQVLPSGSFERVVEDGRVLVREGSYQETAKPDYPVWRWFTAPFEVLASPDAKIVIVLILFMLFVGASFRVLEKGGILTAALSMIVARFKARRYLLMAAVMLFFSFAPAVLGIYEELVPAIVFIVPLALALGWDSMTGLGMSLLALAFGFSSAITNPFTVGVAQSIAGLPLFSGAFFRVLFFSATFALTFLFVYRHARKVERNPLSSPTYHDDQRLRAEVTEAKPIDAPTKRAVAWMAAWFGVSVLAILVLTRFDSLRDFVFPLVALIFLIAGVGAGLAGGMSGKAVLGASGQGAFAMMGPIPLILMAMSVKVIIQSGGILDTVLHGAEGLIRGTDPLIAAFFMYAVTLFMNFFIASASAKAFLIMPILVPLADIAGLTRQTAVFAYDLGDGFSNMIYPTNALLLIALGLTVVSYPKWIKWSLPLQGIVFLVSMGFLAVAVLTKLGPF